MSKIIIKEQDLTTSPVGAYANFTVLIPGYYANGKYDPETGAPFYGEYAREFSSQNEFVEAIGRIAAKSSKLETTYCKLTPVSFQTSTGDVESRTLPAGQTFYQRDENPISGSEAPSKGYLVMEFAAAGTDTTYYKIKPFISDGVGAISAPGQNEKPNIFVLNDGDDTAEFIYTAGAFDGNTLGSNAQEANSYGNQFAYELLGLGYTVLYADLETLIEQTGDGDGELSSIFEPFEDKAAYDFRYILTGFFNSGKANEGEAKINVVFNADAAKLAKARGDCIALCDLNADEYLNSDLATIGQKVECIKDLAEGFSEANTYTALFANRPTYNISYGANDVYTNKTFSGGFHYLACAAKANRRYAEWFAIAGYTRGVSDFVVDKLDINLGDPAVDILQGRDGSDCQRAVNIMVKVRNQYYLWGNRTAQILTVEDGQDTLTASHFLNIRQLCTTIKKQVYTTCRALTFNPNSDTLWLDYTHRITPTLDYAKTNQGLRTYAIEQVKNNKKAKLTSIIRIVPIEAVEDFEITLSLEDSISGSGNINISESAAQ